MRNGLIWATRPEPRQGAAGTANAAPISLGSPRPVVCDRLVAGVRAKFDGRAAQVALHGLGLERKPFRRFGIRAAEGDLREHVELTRRQRGRWAGRSAPRQP